MDFKRVSTSTKTYIILLVIAVAVLLISAGMAYRQIMGMQLSSERITHTLQVYNAISELSAHSMQAESEEFRRDILNGSGSDNLLEAYMTEGRSIIDSLQILTRDNAPQRDRLETLEDLMDNLYEELFRQKNSALNENQKSAQLHQINAEIINATLFRIRQVRNEMLNEERHMMLENRADYDQRKFLAPLTSLLLAFFALCGFMISFLRIYKNKLRIRESETFLKSILATTDNVVNYYEPLSDKNENIVDFKIAFANGCNMDYFDLDPEEITGRKITEVFPFLILNGELEELIKSYREKTKVDFKRQVSVHGRRMWLHSIVTPLAKGILVTIRNSTAEESAKAEQLALNERLEEQNLTLLDNRAFLNNIFKSISDIVLHLSCIRNKNDVEIVDFQILFINERMNVITGDIPSEVKNKRLSEIYPSTFESGVFEHLVDCVENSRPVEYETVYNQNDKQRWFRATAIKLNDGVTVTTREITEEKEKANQLKQINEELAIQNSIFTEAERVGKIGSYIWYLDTGDAIISDNFYRILGHEPNAFEVTFENYREFVHPDDLESYDKLGKQFTELGYSDVEEYRIITKQGKTKYLRLNGLFVKREGRPTSIGVVQDITDRVKKDEDLRVRNLQLQKTNAELESFNRVASHDLQEPLRKIQMFISRIETTEIDGLSEKGREYFKKVGNAAARMQSLIINLLTYSRIDAKHEDFESIDLNEVLEKAKDNLSTSIENSKTTISSQKLPEIMGVFYQLEQLFSNLISNAIKYKTIDENPYISIESEKIYRSQIPEDFFKGSKAYHKITITDNGIGFDAEHADKIFEVFQRLHPKSQYSGTGIGLAICKKIIENHHGYIYASSEVGKGSAFIFFLPA
ncbi:MAG: PAS domain-containing protein [Pricia sp.]|nr:PAS domain-containing protein [Pricia sp.]